LLTALFAQSNDGYPDPPAPSQDDEYGENIQNFMEKLNNGESVKALFFGQSVTEQEWHHEVMRDLVERYPEADITYENTAHGGCDAGGMLGEYACGWNNAQYNRVPESLEGQDPDLMIFHIYWGGDPYEALLDEMEQYLPDETEVLIWNDHMHDVDEGGQEWHDLWSFELLPAICRERGYGFADIRNPWKQYMEDNQKSLRDLAPDGVHLGDEGNYLLAELIKREMVYHEETSVAIQIRQASSVKALFMHTERNSILPSGIEWKPVSNILGKKCSSTFYPHRKLSPGLYFITD
jgi:hypothetical protein